MAINHLFSPQLRDELFQHNVISHDGRILANDQELQKYKAFLTDRAKNRTFQNFKDRKALVNKVQTLLRTSNKPIQSNEELKISLKILGLHITADGTLNCGKFPEPRKPNLGPSYPTLSLCERQNASHRISKKVQKRDLKQLDDWLKCISDARVQKMAVKTAAEWRKEEMKYRDKMESVLKEMSKNRAILVRKCERNLQHKWISAMERILENIDQSWKMFQTNFESDSQTREVDPSQNKDSDMSCTEVINIPEEERIQERSEKFNREVESKKDGPVDTSSMESIIEEDKSDKCGIAASELIPSSKESDSRLPTEDDLAQNEGEDVEMNKTLENETSDPVDASLSYIDLDIEEGTADYRKRSASELDQKPKTDTNVSEQKETLVEEVTESSEKGEGGEINSYFPEDSSDLVRIMDTHNGSQQITDDFTPEYRRKGDNIRQDEVQEQPATSEELTKELEIPEEDVTDIQESEQEHILSSDGLNDTAVTLDYPSESKEIIEDSRKESSGRENDTSEVENKPGCKIADSFGSSNSEDGSTSGTEELARVNIEPVQPSESASSRRMIRRSTTTIRFKNNNKPDSSDK